jgi:hypothetical protein
VTTLATAILSTLLARPVHVLDRDEPAESRKARFAVAAQGIALASKGNAHEAALLIAQFDGESKGARYVWEDRCHDGPPGARCDPDRKGVARARGAFQVWAYCKEAWAYPVGSLEEVTAAARCTLRLMRSGAKRCSANGYSTIEGSFAGARGGAACVTKRTPERVRTYRWALARLGGKATAAS